LALFSIVWKILFHGMENFGGQGMKSKMKWISAAVAGHCWPRRGLACRPIVHDPVKVAQKGAAGRAGDGAGCGGARGDGFAVLCGLAGNDAVPGGDVEFRGGGLVRHDSRAHDGTGGQMFYYIQAENADGETKETEWQTVKLVESGVAPEAIPSATSVAQQAEQQAGPGPAKTPRPRTARQGRPVKVSDPAGAIIVGGAVAIGGAWRSPATTAAGAAAEAARAP
jgi:hypothetical protein